MNEIQNEVCSRIGIRFYNADGKFKGYKVSNPIYYRKLKSVIQILVSDEGSIFAFNSYSLNTATSLFTFSEQEAIKIGRLINFK